MQVLLTPWKRCDKEAIIRFGSLKVKGTLTFKGIKNPSVIFSNFA